MGYIPIERTKVYKESRTIANEIYFAVLKWPKLSQDVVGKQLIRAADSVAANLVEGDGRPSDRDSAKFFDYSRASNREARHWIGVALDRGLIAPEQHDTWLSKLEDVSKMITGLTAYRRRIAGSAVREERLGYEADNELPWVNGKDPLDDLTT